MNLTGNGVFMMAKITDDNKLEIIIKYEDGIKVSKLAMQYGISVTIIHRIMARYKKYGIDGILVKHTKRKFTDEFKNEVLKHVDNGEPLDSIALMFNIKHSTINSLNKKRNEIKDNKITSPLTNEERKELIELRKKNKHGFSYDLLYCIINLSTIRKIT